MKRAYNGSKLWVSLAYYLKYIKNECSQNDSNNVPKTIIGQAQRDKIINLVTESIKKAKN